MLATVLKGGKRERGKGKGERGKGKGERGKGQASLDIGAKF